MDHFVFIIGPYDSTFVGPMSLVAAQAYASGVPSNFDAYVYTREELEANFATYGEQPIYGVAAYSFGIRH